jgi:hypothetical protein
MTRSTNHLIRAAALLGTWLLLFALFAIAHVWFSDWGSTASERVRPLPGDDLAPRRLARAGTSMARQYLPPFTEGSKP